MAAFDAMFLVLMFESNANIPIDSSTGQPVERAKERIEYLIDTLTEQNEKIIVPTPALSEFLVGAKERGADYLTLVERQSTFSIEPFGKRAAIELATVTRLDRDAGDKSGGVDGPWQKVKFDRQNVAIAKVAGARTFYTDDPGIRTFAQRAGLKVVGLADLDLPPEDQQRHLDFGDASEND